MEKFLLIKEQLRQSLEKIREEEGVNVGILFPPDGGLAALGTDGDSIKAAVMESARGVIDEFGGIQPQDLELYEGTSKG